MTTDKEKVESFFLKNKFNPKLIPEYVKFISDTFDSFKTFSDIVFDIEKKSDLYNTIQQYHGHALWESDEYRKMYDDAVNETIIKAKE